MARNFSRLEQGNIEAAIRKGFIDFDKEMALDEDMREDLAGTTAICVIIKDDKLFCGNVGDSRAIASVNGNVETLSNDHKPNNEEERKRITAAGGWVEFNRVNGIWMADHMISMFFWNGSLSRKSGIISSSRGFHLQTKYGQTTRRASCYRYWSEVEHQRPRNTWLFPF